MDHENAPLPDESVEGLNAEAMSRWLQDQGLGV